MANIPFGEFLYPTNDKDESSEHQQRMILKGSCEDFKVSEISILNEDIGTLDLQYTIPHLSTEDCVITKEDSGTIDSIDADNNIDDTEIQFIINDTPLLEKLSALNESTKLVVCNNSGATISLQPISISKIPPHKNARRAVHDFIHSQYKFLKTRFEQSSNCIEVSPNFLFKSLGTSGLPADHVESLMRYYVDGPGHHAACNGIQIAQGVEREARSDIHRALASSCTNLDCKTVDTAEGERAILIKFRNKTQKRAAAKCHGAVKATCHLRAVLCKRDVDHFRLIAWLTQSLALPQGALGFAGIKDKKAVTWQHVTITLSAVSPGASDNAGDASAKRAACEGKAQREVDPPDPVSVAKQVLSDTYMSVASKLVALSNPDIMSPGTTASGIIVGNLALVAEPLTPGRLKGNRFEIVLRSVHSFAAQRMLARLDLVRSGGFPNYFGLQRMGGGHGEDESTFPSTPTGVAIGRQLLQGNAVGAVKTILLGNERPEAAEYQRLLRQGSTFSQVLSCMAPGKAGTDRERLLVRALVRFNCVPWNNVQNLEEPAVDDAQMDMYRMALLQVPFATRLLWVNAFQSWMWNDAAAARVALGRLPTEGDLIVTEVHDAAPSAGEESTSVRILTGSELEHLSENELESLSHRIVLPLFGSRVVHATHEVGRKYKHDLAAAGLDSGNENILPHKRAVLHAFPKGAYRKVFQMPSNLNVHVDAQEGIARIQFELPAGSYATCLMRELSASCYFC